MQENQSDHQQSVSCLGSSDMPGPVSMFFASIVIIFIAEALVMLLIYSLELSGHFLIGLVDAALLSLVVVPTLYFVFLKPMRKTILALENSEKNQKKLEEIDQLKSDFISIAAHELCTPVSAIMGYTEVLLDDVESDKRTEYLEVIHSKTQALERIIDDLVIVDQFEKGESLYVVPAEHDLVKTVNQACKVYQLRFPELPIHLDLPEEPLVLLYDEVRISQVLDNLLSNSLKYSNDIHDVVEVSVVDQEAKVLIRIRDEGIGMTADEVSQIYGKFFRAQTEKSVVGGLGLGMAIVKNIIDSHDGSIDIVSQKQVGTTVTITLPK
jgi:signal transduction histidine kinase